LKRSKRKIRPSLILLQIVDNEDGTTSVSFNITKNAEKIFRKAHNLHKLKTNELHRKIGEIILKYFDENTRAD